MSRILSSGIDGSTGAYLFPEMDLAHFASATRGQALDQPEPRALQSRFDDRDLADAGWGIIFPEGADPALRENLSSLIHCRRERATRRDARRFRELTYLPGETKLKFLRRNGSGPGPVDPRKLPFYLLLVGSPEQIPFDLQYALGVQHAVGRLCFDDLEAYAGYADSVVSYETGPSRPARRATFFAPSHADDPATGLSTKYLVEPLLAEVADASPDWLLDWVVRERATKTHLQELLGGSQTPDLLFTAGHAVGFGNGNHRQRPHQGALLCADWPGPRQWRGRIPPDHYFAADDVAEKQLGGLVSFHFACYSAGTPKLDSFPRGGQRRGKAIAPEAFVARLPQTLTARGALAVIGHVDRAWEPSFVWTEKPGDAEPTSQIQVFADALFDIMQGAPVGLALTHFGRRYAEIASELLFGPSAIPGTDLDDPDQALLWTACNDARSYVVAGDPAVRLRRD
ncbi:MAG: hypothetical protein AAF657_26975 [Acidobacteriota bacterium]